MEKELNPTADLLVVARRIGRRRWLFVKVGVLVFALACLLILPVPRYYRSSVELAPELGLSDGGGGLSSLATSFGLNLGSGLTGDAILPDLYPELIKSNDFIYRLTSCTVRTADGRVRTSYYRYLAAHQKRNILLAPLRVLRKKSGGKPGGAKKIDPFRLTEQQNRIFERIRHKINCAVDIKTRKITIVVEDQDPLVAATMAENVRLQLQQFITRYRTGKAQRDLAYYTRLTRQAKQAYERARRTYSSYADANMDVLLASFRSKRDDLENDMQIKFNTYSALNNQLQTARAKVQERTPAFTVIRSATVPLKPVGPKRMAFVAAMLVLGWAATALYVCRDLLAARFTR